MKHLLFITLFFMACQSEVTIEDLCSEESRDSMSQAGFDIGYVGPNQNSAVSLSTGIYSLSSRSNVPYVSLIGRSGFKKIFSWGEIVEVPPHEACTVRNESFHGGDIYINAGCDTDNRPARITVPVQYSLQDSVLATPIWTPEFPADVRLARRAFLFFDASTGGPPLQGYALNGLRVDGSHRTANEVAPLVFPGLPGSGYTEFNLFPAFTAIGSIPLGHLAPAGDDTRPQALLTTATVYISPVGLIIPFTVDGTPNAYYTMEY